MALFGKGYLCMPGDDVRQNIGKAGKCLCSNIPMYGNLVVLALFISKMTLPCRHDLLVWLSNSKAFAQKEGAVLFDSIYKYIYIFQREGKLSM